MMMYLDCIQCDIYRAIFVLSNNIIPLKVLHQVLRIIWLNLMIYFHNVLYHAIQCHLQKFSQCLYALYSISLSFSLTLRVFQFLINLGWRNFMCVQCAELRFKHFLHKFKHIMVLLLICPWVSFFVVYSREPNRQNTYTHKQIATILSKAANVSFISF